MPDLFTVPTARKINTKVGGSGKTRILNSCGNSNGTCSRITELPYMSKGKKKKGKMC